MSFSAHLLVKVFSILLLNITITRSASFDDTTFFPSGLDELPACSKPCLSKFIQQSFKPFVCSTPPSLSCLCSYGDAGLSLGDAFATCFYNACRPTQKPPTSYPELDLCSSKTPIDQAALILDAAASAAQSSGAPSGFKTSVMAQSAIPSRTTLIAGDAIVTTISTLSPKQTVTPDEISTFSSTSSESVRTTSASSSPSASATATYSTATQLGPGGLAGIAFAGFIALVITCAAIGSLIACLRKRRQNRLKHDVGEAVKPRRRFRSAAKDVYVGDAKFTVDESDRKSLLVPGSPRSTDPMPKSKPRASQIGLAVSPEGHYTLSPVSPRGLSNALGARSSNALAAKSLDPVSPETYTEPGTSRFGRRPQLSPTRLANPVPPPPLLIKKPIIPPVELPADPMASRKPSLPRLQIPSAHPSSNVLRPVSQHKQQPNTFSVTQALTGPLRALSSKFSTTVPQGGSILASARTSRDYVPSYYMNHSHLPSAGAASETGESINLSPETPATSHLPPPRRMRSMRRQIRNSDSSTTSFETAFEEDDPTPPELALTLETVQESSPARVTYPRVPKPSSMAVSRRYIPQAMKDARSSSLLKKRRGSGVSQDMSRNLWITNSNSKAFQDGRPFVLPPPPNRPPPAALRPVSPDRRQEMIMSGSPMTERAVTPKRGATGLSQ